MAAETGREAGKAGAEARERGCFLPRGCLVALGVLVALVAAVALAAYLYDRHWGRKLEARLAEYRAAGQPATWEEFVVRREEEPYQRTSAELLSQAFRLLRAPDTDRFGVFMGPYASAGTAGARHSDALRELARACLEGNAQALELIRDASAAPPGSFPLGDTSIPYEVLLEHCSKVRQCALLCADEAVFRAESGRPAQAARSLRGARSLPASLGGSPVLMEAVVRIALDAIWVGGLERSLELCELPAGDLSALREQAAAEDRDLSLDCAFESERAAAAWYFARPIAEFLGGELELSVGVKAACRAYDAVPGWRQKDALWFFDRLDGAIRATRMPFRERLKHAQGFEAEVERTCTGRLAQLQHLRGLILIPALGRASVGEVTAHINLQVAGAALAAEEWRMKHGAWPDSLEELVPELLERAPEDPFGEGSIQYRKTDTGVVVYSLGPDGKDDRGVSQEEADRRWDRDVDSEPTWDIGFRLLDPERRGVGQTTFAEDAKAAGLTPSDLLRESYTREELEALGFSKADLDGAERR
jgi:hypothetical protein